MPTGPNFVTPGQVLKAVQDYFVKLTDDREEFKSWVGGSVDGGPNNDGDYPLTDFSGHTILVACPAKISDTVLLAMNSNLTKRYNLWSELSVQTPQGHGIVSIVTEDAGTHNDPVTNLMVNNSGIYMYHLGETAWTKIADMPPIVSNDVFLTNDADNIVPTQKAVRTFLEAGLETVTRMIGEIDCSTNPMFPEALKGDIYTVSEKGLIGGALGQYVIKGTLLLASEDNEGGNLATAGTSWFLIGNHGIPVGGQPNQMIRKKSNRDYEMEWVNPSSLFTSTVQLTCTDPSGSDLAVKNGVHYFRVPSTLNGTHITSVAMALVQPSNTNKIEVRLVNVTSGNNNILSTNITINIGETDSNTAAIPYVIDEANDLVSTGDMIRVDIINAGNNAKGLIVELQFN